LDPKLLIYCNSDSDNQEKYPEKGYPLEMVQLIKKAEKSIKREICGN